MIPQERSARAPRRRTRLRPTVAVALALAPAASAWQDEAPAEESVDDRLDRLERENEELNERLGILAEELERFELRDVMPPVGQRYHGLDRAASKVYAREQGLSIGGYGELLYENYTGDAQPDRLDLLRAVLYTGYKFDDRWVFNSEIEYEHAQAGEDAEGEVSVEFAYLDYLASQAANARVGLVLIPMGFLNEQHEPTSYLSPTRPLTERYIIPSTWRENGAGIFGEAGRFSYRAYVVNGLDGAGFSSTGLRGGRQSGSEALAEDMALVARLDWTNDAGLRIGASAWHGDSGQGQAAIGDVPTTIYEAHLDFRWRGLWVRALGAMADLDDVATLNQGLGLTGADSVGEEMTGAYVTAGYDLMAWLDPDTSHSLTPFLRWETIDTQAAVPAGYASDPANDEQVTTFGLNYQPIDQIVFKLAYQDYDRADDRYSLQVGYVF
jgi:hypothetical protein